MAGWIAAAGSIIGGLFSSSASSKADKSNEKALEYARQGKYEGLAYLNSLYPYQASGLAALYGLNRLTGRGPRSQEEARYLQMLSQGGPGKGSQQDIGAIQKQIDDLQASFQNQEQVSGTDQAKLSLLMQQLEDAKKSNADIDAYNAELSRLKGIVDQQATDPAYSTGTDYLRSLPGYQFRYGQGLRGVQASQAARGNYFSGSALKELTRYGQGIADQTYNDEYNRLMQTAGLGMNVPLAQANIATGQGNSLANIALGQANNAWNAANSYNNALQAGLSNYAYLKGKEQPSSSYGTWSGNSPADNSNLWIE